MKIRSGKTERIYLDHNATTPIDPAVLAAMRPHLEESFGNPSSVASEDGRLAAQAIERARAQVAAAIGARPNEIVFTGSCTEADNLAILGVARAHPGRRHVVTTAIEHPAVLGPARALERQGWRLTVLPVDEKGLVSAEAVADAITEETALVSVMSGNNEVGSLQPLRAVGAACEARGVLFHSDLAQTVAYHAIDVEREGLHLASLSAHKAYGPKGVGALYVRSRRPRVAIEPIMHGGGQERGLRPGTVATALVVGMGEALAIVQRTRDGEMARLRGLCAAFAAKLERALPDTRVNGPREGRLADNLSLWIPGVEPLALTSLLLDKIAFSASSACASAKVETSHVLLAMFGDVPRARQAFRIAPGRFTTAIEMEEAVRALIDVATALRGTMAA